jgi:hypothetical protein
MAQHSVKFLLAAFAALFVTTCTPTQAPPEAPAPASPGVSVSPPFDVQEVIQKVTRAFRAEQERFTSAQHSYTVQVEREGAVHFTAHAWKPPEGDAASGTLLTSEALVLRTTEVSRAGRSLLREPRASVREDGALALDRGPVVEVLENGELGLEQRWELASKPSGTGDLEVRVELTGLRYVGETEHGHHYSDPRSGLGVRYGQATWVDARSVRTAVKTVREAGTLLIRVPSKVLEDSSWPAVLDPIITPQFHPDSPVPSYTENQEDSPATAYANGIYLVVWDTIRGGQRDIVATRVRASDGVVLDVSGIPLASSNTEESHATVAAIGDNFLVAWRLLNGGIYMTRVRGSDGQVIGPPSVRISGTSFSAVLPATACDNSTCLVIWNDPQISAAPIRGVRIRASDGAVLDAASIPISQATNSPTTLDPPAVAFDGTQFLVAWSVEITGGTRNRDLYAARVRASDGVVLDPVRILVSNALDTQTRPAIAFAGGNFFVAWVDLRTTTVEQIHGARVRAADGVVLDPSGIPITSTPQRPTEVVLSTDGSQFLAVWQTVVGTNNYAIRAARISGQGVVLDTSPVTLALSTTSEAHSPSVAFDGSNYLLTWMRREATSRLQNIYGARIRASELVLLEPTGTLLSTRYNSQLYPAVAQGGDMYLVVWSDSRNPATADDLYGVRVAANGTVLDAAAIPISTATNYQHSPQVAFDGTNFLVVWSPNTLSSIIGVRGARVRASDGVVLDPAGISISASQSSMGTPKVAFGDGLYFVVWSDRRNFNDLNVYGVRVRASDGVVLDPNGITVTSAVRTQEDPVVAFGAGSFFVAWEDDRVGTNFDLYGARVRSSDGVVLDPAGIALSTVPTSEFLSRVAFDGTYFLTIWQDLRTGGIDVNIYGARVRASTGERLDPQGLPLVTEPGAQRYPSLSFDGNVYLLVWGENRNGIVELRGARVRPDGTPLDGTSFLIATESSAAFPDRVAIASSEPGRYLIVTNPEHPLTRAPRVTLRWVLDLPNGAQCSSSPQCASGYCVDGVCCDSACEDGICGSGTCEIPPPGITCPGPVVAEATSAAGALVTYPPASVSGTPPLSVAYSQESGTGFPLGTTSVTATVTDGLGATNSCSFPISVSDTTPPAISCPGDITVQATSPQGATVTYPPATASDSVSAVTLSYSQASGSHFNVGTTPVSVTATDGAGNTSTCSFSVTVQLPPAPQITCPGPVVAEATSAAGAIVSYAPATATGSPPLSVSYSQSSGTAFALGITSVTATVTDGLGRTQSCAFTVTVQDTTAPSLSCGGDLVAEATGPGGAAVSFTLPNASDAVTAVPSVAASHASGSTFPLGSTQVTVTATDQAGNASTCSLSITVRDTTAPALTCPGNLTMQATSTTGATVTYLPATASDAVSNVTVVYSHASGSHFNVGTTPVSVTAADGAGNTSTCSFSVTVNLPPPPQITCPGPVMAEATSSSGAIVSYAPATATGAQPLSVSYSQSSGTAFALGTTSVTATVTDGLGRTSSCTFTVTVQDTNAPELTCGADLVAEATSPGGAAVSFPQPSASDAVTPAPSVSVSHASGSTFPLGTTQVTASATDQAGNTSTCSFTITVRDTTAPALTCPGNLTVQATSPQGATVTYPPATASDAVSAVSLSYSHASGSHFNVGTTPVSVTATDGAGNASICSFTVTVQLPPSPEITCPGPVVAEATSASGTIVSYTPATATGSPPLSVSYSQGSGTAFALGTTSVTATVTDALGRTSSCAFTVTVQDTTAPSLSCGADLVAEATGPGGAPVSFTLPTTTDAVTAVPSVSVSHASDSTFPLGSTQVTVSATDEAGNASTCSFSITVRDTTAPALTCPGNLTVQATSTTGAAVTYLPATASDAVSNVTVAYSQASGSHFNVGTTPVSVTATDAAGNASTCSFTVTVQLPPAPRIICPGPVVAEATSASGATVSYAPATATGAQPLTVGYSQSSGTQFALGTTSVTATVTDGLGRTNSCTFTVTVQDTTAPSLSCGADLVAEATGPGGAPVSFTLPTTTDAVTAVPSVSVSHASGSTFPLGTTQVTVTATDQAGNASSCAFAVTVRDTTAPTLMCPGNLSVQATSTTGATVTYPPATASDSVSNVTVAYSQASGSHFNVGTTPVSVTATDAAGNASTCSFTVTVQLPPAPQIICPGPVLAEATSAAGATVSYAPATATGSPPLSVSYSQGSGTAFALGTTSVTATVTDGLGRTNSCTFTVTVQDTTAPSLSCGADLVAEATGLGGAPVSFTLPTASDAVTAAPNVAASHASGSTFSLGSTQVTVTATDQAGNASTCSFSITVRDTTAPTLMCPGNLSVQATSTTGATVTYPPATVSDSVSNVTVTYSQAPGSHFNVGTTPVSVTATDAAGNASTCSFTVTVQLPPAPEITCPGPVVAEATSAAGAIVSYAPATATGAQPLTVSYSQGSGTAFALGTTSVTATVTDGLGRTQSCTFTIIVQDTTAPSLSCGADLVAEATGPGGAPVSFTLPSASDAVTAVPSVAASHASGSTFPLGSTQVTVTATDQAGNTSTCSFTIAVRDTTAPALTCPGNLSVQATSAQGATVSYPPAAASDAVSAVSLSYSHASGSHFNVGTTPVSVTATDAAGNASNCSFTVTVQLPPAPEITCPVSVVSEATSSSGAMVSYTPATATGSPPLSVSYSQSSGTQFVLGTTSVTATVTDGLGRTSYCAFTVTVQDTTAPSLSCGADLVAEAAGPGGAPVSLTLPSASDAVTAAPNVAASHASGSTFPLGTTQVTVTATDQVGNASSCSFTVTVRDTTAPTLTCPGNLSVQATSTTGATVSYPPAAASDAVSAVTLSYSHASGSHFEVGTTPVSVTATDEAGNASNCSFTVTVQLPPAPESTCPVSVVSEATSSSGAMVSYAPATATGSQPLSVSYSQGSGTAFALGTTSVTATATDSLGRTQSCTFTITVRDTTAPLLSCGADLVAEAAGPDGAAVSFTPPTASDAVTSTPSVSVSHSSGSIFPLGITQVTASVTDLAGNASTCTFTVTVRDTTAPSLTCGADVVAEATVPDGATVNFTPPTATDAVTATPNLTLSHVAGSRFPLGTTLITVTASDETGNATSCTFSVTVRDTTAPTLSCPADVAVTNAPAQGIAVEYPAATSTDAVSTPVLSYSHASGSIFPVGTTQVTATATDAAGNSATCSFQVRVDASVSMPAPSEGCGCGADTSTPAGLGWGALLLLAWSMARRRRALAALPLGQPQAQAKLPGTILLPSNRKTL